MSDEWAAWGFQAGQPYLQGLHRTRLGATWWARSLRRRGYGPTVVRRLPAPNPPTRTRPVAFPVSTNQHAGVSERGANGRERT